MTVPEASTQHKGTGMLPGVFSLLLPPAVLLVSVLTALALQELSTLGTAWMLGYRDDRLRFLLRHSLARSYDLVGWLVLPSILILFVQLGVPLPLWGYSRPLLIQSPSGRSERRDWMLIQLSVIPVLLLVALAATAPYELLRFLVPTSIAAPLVASFIKTLILLSALHLIPVPPFALGRALPWWWRDRQWLRITQGILLAVVLGDGLFGSGAIATVLGALTDLLLAGFLVLT